MSLFDDDVHSNLF